MSGARRLISSGGPYEERFGYSRAVVVGDSCWVAGTTDAGPDGASTNPGDAAAQTRAAFGIAIDALRAAGFAPEDVVRTRMYVIDAADASAAATVHGDIFGSIRPVSALVVVAALLEPSMRVEVELDACRSSGS